MGSEMCIRDSHIAAMSANAIAVVNGVLSYDFTSNLGYSSSMGGQSEVSTGVYALWSGDLDGDGMVNASDRSVAWNLRNNLGYLGADSNLDGSVNAADRSVTWNKRNKATQVP